MASVELTELHDIKVRRQDGVQSPASGFPILLMKSVGKDQNGQTTDADYDYDADPDDAAGEEGYAYPIYCANCGTKIRKAVNAVGGIDEKPDIAGAEHILCELAKLIQAEAAEMATGCWSEIWDIQTLAEASCLMRMFLNNEEDGDEDDGHMMKSALSAEWLVCKAHRKFSSDDRKRLASEGKALPDGSYPIPDADALRRAAILARSGHGDVAAARRLIARRAKELGVPNPLSDSDAKKDTDEGTDLPQVRPADSDLPEAGLPDPDSQVGKETSEVTTSELGDEDVAKQLEESQAEVSKAKERIEALESELAVLKATPIPGGPVLTATGTLTEQPDPEALAKAAYHRRMIAQTQDRGLIRYHTEKLAEAEASARS